MTEDEIVTFHSLVGFNKHGHMKEKPISIKSISFFNPTGDF